MVKGRAARSARHTVGLVLVGGFSIGLARRWRTRMVAGAVAAEQTQATPAAAAVQAGGSTPVGAANPAAIADPASVVGLLHRHVTRATDDDQVLARYRVLLRETRWFVVGSAFTYGAGLAVTIQFSGASTGSVIGIAGAAGGGLTLWFGAVVRRRLRSWRAGRADPDGELAARTPQHGQD
jgi:hypothetical protein